MSKSSCLKPQAQEPWFVALPCGPLPSLLAYLSQRLIVKIIPPGPKKAPPGGQMFYKGLCTENVKKTSCLTPQGQEP